MSFMPNIAAVLFRKAAKRDIHGKEFFGPGVPIRLSVVHLADVVESTSVRADQSASRGSGEQEILQAKLLIPVDAVVIKGDVIVVLDRKVEVSSVHQRIDVMGNLHHLEVGGNIKGDMHGQTIL